VCLGEVLVFADEDDDRVPEVLGLVLLEPISNDFGFADVCKVSPGLGVDAQQEIDARTFKLFSSEKIFQFSPRRGEGLSGPVGNLTDAQALCVALRQKELDGCGSHGEL
jgi:hypothetical protein